MNKRLLIIGVSLVGIMALCVIYRVKWGQPVPAYHQPLRSFSYIGRYGTGIPTFAPNDHTLAIMTEPNVEPQTFDFTAVMVDADTGCTQWRFAHVGPSGDFSRDSHYFYSVGNNGLVRCDMITGKEQVMVATKGTYQGLLLDLHLLLVNEKDVLVLYDTRSGQAMRRLPGNSDQWYGVALSFDGRSIAVASETSAGVRVYDVKSGLCIAHLKTPSDSKVAFSRDGTQLVTVSAHNPVTVWETRHWTQVKDLPVENYTQVWGIYFRNNGNLVVSGQIEPNRHNIHELWDVKAERRLIETPGVDFVISQDGRRVAAVNDDQQGDSVVVSDLNSGRGLFRFSTSHTYILHPCFSYDGTLLAECSNDNPATYQVWHIPR